MRPGSIAVLAFSNTVLCVSGCLALATMPGVAAAEEASIYVIETWPGPPTCDCAAKNEVDEWEDMVQGWIWRMDNHDDWVEDQYYVDSPILEGMFSDEEVDPSNGDDESYLDDADAALYAGHGGTTTLYSSLYWAGRMRERDSEDPT